MGRGYMIDPTELDRLLRKWGSWFGVARPAEWDEESSHGSGALTSVLMQFLRVGRAAIGAEPVLGERTIHLRDGTDLVQPTRFTAKGKESDGGERPWLPDTEADRVEQQALELYRYNKLRAVVLRMEYCTRGRQRDKAPAAAVCLELRSLKLRRYRMELDFAREWMAGALSGRKVA